MVSWLLRATDFGAGQLKLALSAPKVDGRRPDCPGGDFLDFWGSCRV
jgi:hypothetical protein